MDQFERSVAAVLRIDARMRSATFDLDVKRGTALAPHGKGVRRIPRLEVQLDVSVLEELADEGLRSGRAAFFRRLHEKDDLAEVPEARFVQNLQRVDTIDHPSLFVGHPGPVRPLAFGAIGPAPHRPGPEHGTDAPGPAIAAMR